VDTREPVFLATTEALPGWELGEYVMLVGAHDSDPGRALDRLADRARELDADAVLAIRMTSTAVGSVMLGERGTFAYGTAVRLRRRTGG
jgi:uncharacterized protein YbjQ (UPF0145 family)